MGVVTALFLTIAIIFGLVLAVTVLPVLVSSLSPGSRDTRRELRESKSREKIATQALRAIANGDSMPVLTAGDALDRIENTYNKELTR
jgi:hypothetical protein